MTALLGVKGMTPEILRTTNIAVSDAYSRLYAYVYYFAVAIGGLAIIASLCMRDFDKYLNSHVSRHLYHRSEASTDPLEATEMAIASCKMKRARYEVVSGQTTVRTAHGAKLHCMT
jgi:hypothetical protein